MKFAENSKFKTDLKIQVQISKHAEMGPGGKTPAQPGRHGCRQGCRLACRHACRLGCRQGCRLALSADAGLVHLVEFGLGFGAGFWKLPKSDGPNLT